jgi:hypothetical protein
MREEGIVDLVASWQPILGPLRAGDYASPPERLRISPESARCGASRFATVGIFIGASLS